MTDAQQINEILLAVSLAKHGVAVSTNRPETLRQRLYPAMKKMGVKFSVTVLASGEVWVYKQ